MIFESLSVFSNPVLNVIFISIIIFLSRIIDVPMGTLRMVFIAKGKKTLASILGFVEVFIWIIVVQQMISAMDNIFFIIAYAGGFAAGTYIGLAIEDRFAHDRVIIRIISGEESKILLKRFRELKCCVTCVDAKKEYWNKNQLRKVKVYYIVSSVDRVKEILTNLREVDHNAQYTVENITDAVEDIFETKTPHNSIFRRFHFKKYK